MSTDTLPETDATTPAVLFSVVDGSAVDAAGTGLEQDPTATDCTAIGATLTVTNPDGTTTSVPVGQDGVATPLSLPPTTGDARYTIRDDASGAEQAVAVDPAATTTVTMVVLPDGVGDDASDDDSAAVGGTDPGASGASGASAASASDATTTTGVATANRLAGPVSLSGQTLDAVPGAESTEGPGTGTAAERVEDATDSDDLTVRALPRTGAGVLVLEARDHQRSILLALTALLAVAALAMTTGLARPSAPTRRRVGRMQ